MKLFLSMALSLFAASASATEVDQESVNKAALEILLKYSGMFTSEDDEKVSEVLASNLITSEAPHKVINYCIYSEGEAVYECHLKISNVGENFETEGEGSTIIVYELKRGSDGLPSEEEMNFIVRIFYAG